MKKICSNLIGLRKQTNIQTNFMHFESPHFRSLLPFLSEKGTIAFDTVGNYSMNETFPLSYVPEWIGLTVYFTCINYTYLSTKKHIPLNNRSFTIDLTKVYKI